LSGGTFPAAAVAGLVFALSGPAVETFYTLSKAESVQAVWIGLALLATAASARDGQSRARRLGWMLVATTAALLAHATKETSVILVPIALGWLALERRARPGAPCYRRFAATLVLVAALAAAAFFALRWQYAALALGEGTYTRAYSGRLETVGPALFRLAAWLLRDFAWLAPVVAAAVVLAVRGVHRRPIVYTGVWMLGWLAVYLPWPATFAYYLLPFALGAAVLAGTVVVEAWTAGGGGARGAVVATAVLWLVGVVNVTTDARVQLAVDRANAGVVDFLGTLPRDSRVLLNMTPVNEYHFELPMHLAELERRPDIRFVARLEPRAGEAAFVLTPVMSNQPGPTVRIALHEAGARRDAATLPAVLGDGGELVYEREQRIRLLELGLQRLLCPLGVPPVFDPTYCPRDRGLLFQRTFTYGWQVHRVVRRAANAATMAHGG